MLRIAAVLLVIIAPVGHAQSWRDRPETLFVADRFISDTTTMGARITAKFDSVSALARELDLTASVATYAGRTWRLRDILVITDFNGNGYVATWMVAGPRDVIEAHLARITTLTRDRRPIYDYGIKRLAVRCACD